MLVASHAFFSTLEAPFSAAGWNQVTDSTFGSSNVNSVVGRENSEYVAVGDLGKIAVSIDDGVTWSSSASPFSESNIYSIAYGNGMYIAGGSLGKIATSPNGTNWTSQVSGFGASPVLGINYFASRSLWVAVGGSGKLATSPDGVTWTLRSSSFSVSFINSVISTESLAIAVGFDGKLATSTNGIDWTQRTSSFVFDTIFDVAYSTLLDKYVAVGDIGKVATSTDGLTWTQVFPNTSFGSSSIRTVGANEVVYVAGGSLGKIGTSSLGESWIQKFSSFGESTINDIHIADQSAVAVGAGGKIAYSA